MLRHALGCEFEPGDNKLFFGPKHNNYTFLMILFGFLIWYYYLSVKEIYFWKVAPAILATTISTF